MSLMRDFAIPGGWRRPNVTVAVTDTCCTPHRAALCSTGQDTEDTGYRIGLEWMG